MLPPLSRAELSRPGLNASMLSGLERQNSRTGSYAAISKKGKNPMHERVLFPTQVKESFLQRNKHMASVKMEQMANDFAKRAVTGAL